MSTACANKLAGVEVDFDPEFAGDHDAVRAQMRIFEQTHSITATKGFVSRGSRVGLLDAWRQSPQIAIDIAKEFEFATFFLRLDQREEFMSRFRGAGLGVSSPLRFSSREAAFTLSDAIL